MGYLSYSAFVPIISLIILLTYAVTTSCVFIIKQKNSKRSFYILLNIVLALWSLSIMYFLNSPDKATALMRYKISAVGFCTYYILVINFSLILRTNGGPQKRKLTVPVIFSLYIPMAILFLSDDLSFINLYKSGSVWMYSITSPDLWFISYLVGTVIFLYINLKSTELIMDKNSKRSMIIFLISQSVPLIIVAFTNVVLPALNIHISLSAADMAILIYTTALNYSLVKESLNTKSSVIPAKQIISKIMDMIIITDTNGRIVEVNDSIKELSGYSEAELIGKDIDSLFNPKLCFSAPNVKATGYNLLTNDNNYMSVDISVSQIFSEGNVLLGTTYVLQDTRPIFQLSEEVTEKSAIIKHTDEQLKELDKLKSEFLCNVSHELRTPLNLMISSLKLSALKLNQKNGVVDPTLMYKHFDVMNHNCFRLTRVINNIIDITKIDAGSLELNLSNNNIVEIVEETVLSVASFIKKKDITLIFDTDVEEKCIACDPDQIQRILLNLVSNAVKFNTDGREIYVSITESLDDVKISVKDNGIGISPENQQSIFDRFKQVDKSLTRQHEGSGIGLTITKYLVELHKGTITLESELGKGSTFTITLPVYLVPNSMTKRVSTFAATLNEKVSIEFSDVY